MGLARIQNAYVADFGAFTEYSACPSFSSEKFDSQSPPESWSFLTWSYHQGCRFIVDRSGFSPSCQIVWPNAFALMPTANNDCSHNRRNRADAIIVFSDV